MTLNIELAMDFAALFLSICIFSLIFGDNWLFRFASSILSGAMAGFFCVYLVQQFFSENIINVFLSEKASSADKIVAALVILSALFLISKALGKKSALSDFIMALLLSVASAVMITGIVNGTILGFFTGIINKFDPQFVSAKGQSDPLFWIQTAIILIGLFLSLFYTRHFTLQRKKNAQAYEIAEKTNFIDAISEIFIGFSLGAIFAGCFIAAAFVLINHLDQLIVMVQMALK